MLRHEVGLRCGLGRAGKAHHWSGLCELPPATSSLIVFLIWVLDIFQPFVPLPSILGSSRPNSAHCLQFHQKPCKLCPFDYAFAGASLLSDSQLLQQLVHSPNVIIRTPFHIIPLHKGFFSPLRPRLCLLSHSKTRIHISQPLIIFRN